MNKIKTFFNNLYQRYVVDENSFIHRYYIRFFKREESTYGFQFSVKYYIIFYVVALAVVFFVAYLSQLQWQYIVGLMVVATFMFPIIIVAVINQRNELRRFDMVTSYLTNILPIFMQNTKILWALKEVEGLLDYKIKNVVHKAVEYIETNTTDANAEATALKLIEAEFPNSRVLAVNKLMLSIEKDNSVDFKDTCMVMYDDIEAWINRVYDYQKDLANRRTQLALLCILTVGMNVMFISMYQSNDFFKGFGQIQLYQIVTALFLVSIMIVITITLTKLHGTWIVNDNTIKSQSKIDLAYKVLNGEAPKIRKVDVIVASILAVLAIATMILFKQRFVGLIIICLALLIVFYKFIQYKGYENTIKKAFEMEFPLWLRSVSLNLYNMTVLRAIDRSKDTATQSFAEEIKQFQTEAEADPTSLKPYMMFLRKYKINSASAAMKVLYSIQALGTEDIKSQISGLIVRNQRLLQKSEEIRNKDNISSIETLGFIPMILFSIQMLVSLALLVMTVLSKMSVDITW